jgi:hypothetical protein
MPHRSRTLAAAASIASIVLASLTVAVDGTATAVAADDVTTARVSLISAGSSPRSALRLALTEGDVVRREMETTQHVEQSIDGQSTNAVNAPPIVMTLETTVDTVAPDGVAELSFAYTDVTITDDGSLDAAELAQLDAVLAPLESVRGTQSITARNQLLDAEIEGLEGFDATLAQTMSQLSDQAGSTAVPFPAEKVGVGARWQGVTALRVNGIDVRQTYEYELREREGDSVVIGVSYVQSAPPQRAELPGTPKGTVVRVTRFRVTGSGEATVDLTEPLPTASDIEASGQQRFSIRAAGDRGELSQDLELHVTLQVPLLDRPSG